MNTAGDRLWTVPQYQKLLMPVPEWKKHKEKWTHDYRTYITAEVGASWIEELHNPVTGLLWTPKERALAFIEFAKNGGHGDPTHPPAAVKFQYWSDSKKLAAKRRMPEFAERYERSRLPVEWLPELANAANGMGLDFLCTTYMIEDIAAVAPYVAAFKIASFEALDMAFLVAHLPYEKPIFLSTGLTTEQELMPLLALRAKLGRERLRLFHCVSSYPCPYDEVNLSIIRNYDLDGFSDHTGHPIMGALAVMAGAELIEVHIRSEFGRDNPDYPHSHGPDTYQDYLNNIVVAEEAMGYQDKRTQPSEAPNRQYMAP